MRFVSCSSRWAVRRGFASAMLPSVSRSAAASNFDEFPQDPLSLAGHWFSSDRAVLVASAHCARPRHDRGGLSERALRSTIPSKQPSRFLVSPPGSLAFAAARLMSPPITRSPIPTPPCMLSLLSIGVELCRHSSCSTCSRMSFAAMALTTSVWPCGLRLSFYLNGLRHKLGGVDGRYRD